MGRPKKEGHFFNIKLEQSLYDRLQDYCKETGISQTFVAEKGIEMYLDQQNKIKEALKTYKEN